MAQSIAGTNLAATAIALNRRVTCKLEIQWDGTNWVDETSRLYHASGSIKFGDVGTGLILPGKAPTGSMNLKLRNEDYRFTPFNSGSAIYAYTRDGGIHMTPIRFEIGFYDSATPERVRQFMGYIDDPREDGAAKRIEFKCADLSIQLKERRLSTAIGTDQDVGTWIATGAALVGIGSGDRNLDTGMFLVPYVWMEEDKVWEEWGRAAEADGGLVYFDKEGKLTFENAHHRLDAAEHTASQFTFTVSNLKNIHPRIVSENVYKSVLVEVSPREERATTVVYQRDDRPDVPPSKSLKIIALLDWPCTAVTNATEDTDFVTFTQGNRRITGAVTFVHTKYTERVEMVATNANADYALYFSKLQLRGTPLMGGPQDEIVMESAAGYVQDDRAKEIRNLYVQTRSQGDAAAELWRDLLERPKAIYQLRDVPAIPWLEPGDRVTVNVTPLSLNRPAFIVGFDWEYAPEGKYKFKNLDLIDVADLQLLEDYFRANTDALGPNEGHTTHDAATDLTDDGGASDKVAVQFTNTSAITLRSAEMPLLRIGAPGGRIRAAIYSDDGGDPDAAITDGESRYVDTGDVDTAAGTAAKWVPFIFPGEPTLAATTVYHLVLEADADYEYVSTSAEINWRHDAVGSGGTLEKYNGSGETWGDVATMSGTFRIYQNPLFY